MSESEGVYPQYRFRIPAGACDLLLVRHGESAAMPAGGGFPTTASGQADPELSPAGCEQAVLVSARPDFDIAWNWIQFLGIYDAAFLVLSIWVFESLVIE